MVELGQSPNSNWDDLNVRFLLTVVRRSRKELEKVMVNMLKQLLILSLCVGLLISFAYPVRPPAHHGKIINIGAGTHLFVDDHVVDKMEQVWRTLNRPEKHGENPLIVPDKPWEGYLVLQPGTVIWDDEENIFKMWYNTIGTHEKPYVEDYLCYATSRDGIKWEKPDLGQVEFAGSTKNNIFMKWSGWTHCVVKDKKDPDPSRRYKLAYWQTHERESCGIWAAFSADGKKWTNNPENPVVPCWATGDTFQVTQALDSGQFIMHHKTISRPIRKVSRLVSDDFIHWRNSQQVLHPDKYDPPDTEFYGLSAFPYAGQYLGILWVYHTYTQFMDFQLVSSRDSIHWERSVGRRRFMRLAPDGGYENDTFDSGMVYPSSNPIVKDGRIWIYYSGFTNVHNAPSFDHDGKIGLGIMRQDGFVSVDATSEGSVLTKPVKLTGSTLSVNMTSLTEGRLNFKPDSGKKLYSQLFRENPSAQGYIRVEIQDADGNAIPGYEASSCRPIRDNNAYQPGSWYRIGKQGDVYQQVSWEGKSDLSGVRDKTVRLKFLISNAQLYSFRLD